MGRDVRNGIGGIHGPSLPLESSARGCQWGLAAGKRGFAGGNAGAVGTECWGRVWLCVPRSGHWWPAEEGEGDGKEVAGPWWWEWSPILPVPPSRLCVSPQCRCPHVPARHRCPHVPARHRCPRVPPRRASPCPRLAPGLCRESAAEQQPRCPEDGLGTGGKGPVTPAWGPGGGAAGGSGCFRPGAPKILRFVGWDGNGPELESPESGSHGPASAGTDPKPPRCQNPVGWGQSPAGDDGVTLGHGPTGTGVAWEATGPR